MANLQTWVLGNDGTFASQNIGVDEIMAAHIQAQNANAVSGIPRSKSSGPEYGLLSQTLVHSPVVRQILSARIRSESQLDVVFVGVNFLELREIVSHGKLESIICKTDFYSEIRCARVMTIKGEFLMGGLDLILKKEIDIEMDEMNKLQVPPQVLVLTLDSGDLAFCYVKSVGGIPEFVISKRKISSPRPFVKNIGKSISVDPRSRALAVAAYEGSFRLCALHPPDVLERQIASGNLFDPIQQEKTFLVEGVILHLEFLSSQNKNHVVVLVYLIDQRQRHRLVLYEWDDDKPLHTAFRVGTDGLRLPDDMTIPLHMIPLSINNSSFLLVTEFYIFVGRAEDITSGNVNLDRIDIPMVIGRPYQHNRKLITAWARPYRTPAFASSNDDIYLGKENGDIFFIEIDKEGPQLVQTVTVIGNLKCNIGSSFACLEFGLQKYDLIVAAGEMTNGGVFLIQPNCNPKLIQELVNWSPMFDFDLVKLKSPDVFHTIARRHRMFACAGFGEYGIITELRYGIQGRIVDQVEFTFKVNKLWTVSAEDGSGIFLILSLLYGTSIWFLSFKTDVLEDLGQSSSLNIGEDTVTLTIGKTGKDIVQVTSKGIYCDTLADLLSKVGGESEESVLPQSSPTVISLCHENEIIVAAATSDRTIVLVKAVGDEYFFSMSQLLVVAPQSNHEIGLIGLGVLLTGHPSFVEILRWGNELLAIVGTQRATISVLHLHKTLGPKFLLEQSTVIEQHATQSGVPLQDSFIGESVVLLSQGPNRKLVCGLRNGMILAWDIEWDEGSGILDLQGMEAKRVGQLPVQVSPLAKTENEALIKSTYELSRLTLNKKNLSMSQVAFDSTEQLLIETVNSVDQETTQSDYPDSIVYLTGDRLVLASLARTERTCTRRILVDETPHKILYCEAVDVLVVACQQTGPTDPYACSEQELRLQASIFTHPQCTLKFIDPRTGESLINQRDLKDTVKNETIFSKKFERIHCISEWSYNLIDPARRYLLVGTSYQGSSCKRGRIVVLTVQRLASGLEVRKRYSIACIEPVYSIASFGERSIVFGSGCSIFVNTLNVVTKRFENVAKDDLRNVAIHITVNEPYINITSQLEALCVFKYENNLLKRHYSDAISRAGASHMKVAEGLYLASDMDYGILGFWVPPERRVSSSMDTIFDAQLSSSVSRIIKGDLRPPWHQRNALPGVLYSDTDIVASGIDGSIHQLTLINADSVRLLRNLQTLYMENKHPSSASIYYNLPPSEREPKSRHIDGDVLQRLYDMGPDWLRKAVQQSSGSADSLKLDELTRKLLPDRDTEDTIEMVFKHLKELLEGAVL